MMLSPKTSMTVTRPLPPLPGSESAVAYTVGWVDGPTGLIALTTGR